MASDDPTQAQVDPAIREAAAAVLDTMGLTVSDAVRMMLTRVAREKTLPFEPLSPNETTAAAMEAARRGEVERFASVDALMADLRADD